MDQNVYFIGRQQLPWKLNQHTRLLSFNERTMLRILAVNCSDGGASVIAMTKVIGFAIFDRGVASKGNSLTGIGAAIWSRAVRIYSSSLGRQSQSFLQISLVKSQSTQQDNRLCFLLPRRSQRKSTLFTHDSSFSITARLNGTLARSVFPE